jgi:hypothetical protein
MGLLELITAYLDRLFAALADILAYALAALGLG